MRKLAWFAFSFGLGAFACQTVLPLRFMPLAAVVCAALGLVFYGVLRRDWHRRAAVLVGVGLAVGIGWSFGYETVFFSGARALDGAEKTAEARVLDFPAETDYGYTVDVKVAGEGRFPLKTRVYFYDGSPAGLRPGDEIRFTGKFSAADRVGEDRITSFTSRGYFLFARNARELEVLGEGKADLSNFHVYLAKAVRDRIRVTFPPDAADFMLALLTGDRSELNKNPEATAAMERAGVTHIVAVSGMHVSILAGFLLTVLGRSAPGILLTLPVLLLFAAVSGFTASVVRAVVMQGMVLLVPLVYRESDSLTSLSFAMLILLLLNPCAVAGAGFQLSFAATLGIILFTPRMQRAFEGHIPEKKRFKSRALLWVSGSVSTTFGALVLTLPITAWYFGYVSLAAPLTNLLILWAVSPAFLAGALAVGAGFLAPVLGRVIGFYPALLVRFILLAVKLAAKPYLAAVVLEGTAMKVWFGLTYLAVLAFAVFRINPRRAVWVAAVSAVSLCAVLIGKDLAAAGRPGYTLTVLDVGQGQSIVVTSGGYTAVIDCGSSSGEDAGEIAERYVRSLGRGSVDVLILTHYHADHAGGVERLLAGIPVETLAAPLPRFEESGLDEAVLAAAEKSGCRTEFVESRTVLTLGNTEIVLYPPMGSVTENERGLMMCVTSGDFDTLITGDAPETQELQFLERYGVPDIECLVVGHHGSASSTCEELLDRAMPETAVISVGENSYGHPTRKVLDRLSERGIEVLRTDETGNIEIRSVE